MRRVLRVLIGLVALVAVGCDDDGGGDEAVCTQLSCIQTPLPVCEGSFRVTYQAVGVCTEVNGQAACQHPEATRIDCAADGRFCQNGNCEQPPVVPCEGVTCFTPPAPDCDDDIARVYESSGTCDATVPPAGKCAYDVDSTLDCAANQRVCRSGGCIDPDEIPCDPNPCDVPPLGTCSGAQPVVSAALGTCAPGAGGASCSYATTTGAACAGGQSCHAGACASGSTAPTAQGQLVIHEIMRNPYGDADAGEWIELWNPGGAARILDGCRLVDDGSDSFTFPAAGGAVVPAGGFLVLGRSADPKDNGGFVPDVVYGTAFTLANSADEVALVCADVTIDHVAYQAEGWPFTSAHAMSLRPSSTHTTNDQPAAWCDAPAPYGNRANFGSPRRTNPPCP